MIFSLLLLFHFLAVSFTHGFGVKPFFVCACVRWKDKLAPIKNNVGSRNLLNMSLKLGLREYHLWYGILGVNHVIFEFHHVLFVNHACTLVEIGAFAPVCKGL
jgi:hypothetical protein